MSENSCIFCGGQPQALRQTIAGECVEVCEVCASLGRAVLDAGGADCLACLHLTAMALEVECEAQAERRRYRKVLTALRNGFGRSAYRLACACPTCRQVQAGVDRVVGPVVDGSAFMVMTDLGLTMEEMRALPEGSWCAAPDGEVVPVEVAMDLWRRENRRLTADPGVEYAGLRDRAAAVVVQPEGWMAFGAVSSRLAVRRAAKDAAAAQHWNMVRKYGPGLRDGDYWLGRDGSLIPLDDADRVLPMTEEDRKALAEDRQRAAAWRKGGDA